MATLPVDDILAWLGLEAAAPAPDFLSRLLLGWATHIPWESASRIARHQRPGAPADYARRPAAFFADALRLGTGGTCFESNFALRALLEALGFTSTMAFCDMESATVEPHCALLVRLDGLTWLADAGYPIPAALPLDSDAPTSVEAPVYTYAATPVGLERWLIRRSAHRFEQVCFWVNGPPVSDDRFMARLLRDHAPDGQFLREVIIQKVEPHPTARPWQMAAWAIWRYSEGKGLIRRTAGQEESIPLAEEEQADLPAALARRFGMDARVIAAALSRTPPHDVWDGT